MKYASITWRLAGWFAVVAMLPLTLFGYLSLRQHENDLRVEALGRLSRLADKKTMQIKAYLNERVLDVQLLARSHQVEAAFSAAKLAYAQHGPRSAVYGKATKPVDAGFSAYIGEGGEALFYDAFLITPEGEVIYTYKREPDFAANLLDGVLRFTQLTQAFRESRMTHESSISDFEFYAPSGAPAAFISAPVIREGRLLGIFAMQLDTQHIYRVALDNTGLGVSGETPLVKQAGGGEAMFVAPLRSDPQAAMSLKVSLKADPALERNALSGQRGAGMEIDYAGKQVAAAWRYLPELRWGMVVKMDADEVFAPLHKDRETLLEGLLALMLFAAATAYYFGRRLIVPLQDFASTAAEIARGDLGKRVDESRADEIGALGRAFNSMTEKLQVSYRFLEERVAERTRELNSSNELLKQEIAERKQVEANLLGARSQLAATIDAIPDLMFELGLDGTYYEVHTQQPDLLAASPGELLGKRVADILPSKTAETVMAALQEAYHQGQSHGRQIELSLPDGNLWFELSISRKASLPEEEPRFIVLSRDITQRKRAEDELRQTKVRYDYATAIGKVGTWDWQLESGNLIWNDETFRLLDLAPGSATPSFELFLEAVHPDDREFIMASVQAALNENKPYTVDCRLVVSSGGTTFCHIEGRVEYDPEGKPVRMLGTIQDITERKRAELELEYKQGLLNEAQRLGHLGSWELDLVAGRLVWSDEVYRIFELDPSQFAPSYENFLNVIHPDDRDKVNQAYTQSLETRQPYDIVHRLRMADGRIKWVREHCTTDFDADGRPLRSVGAVQDITAHKQAEDVLRIAAVAFETHEAIMITDAHANIIRVNKAFTRITGYQPEEVLGKNPRILSSGRMSMEFYAQMWKELLDTGTWSGEIWDRRKGGEIYPKWQTITALKDRDENITEFVAIFSDITLRKKADEEIRNLAFFDALTGLANRRLLLDHFHVALAASERNQHYGAVLFLDMDRFKTLNDTLGHDHGDLLLLEVAKRIQSSVREVDTVARLGGDEFVVLVEGISAGEEDASQRVAAVAEKIRHALSVPYQLKGHEYHSSPSIGVCLFQGHKVSMDDLLKHADLAMYQAKEAGRNTIRFFDPAMQQVVQVRATLERDLRHAIAGNELLLYYQIQVDADIHPVGAEALLRWVHPGHGMVSPAQFIPVAEESTLILDIGQWVLDTACRQLAAWGRHEQTRNLELAINVSAKQFGQHDFVRQVEEAVSRYDVPPERLKLELTESVVLKDVADVVGKMHALKAIGVRLSLDDFGTGYSSLSYLKRLPLDQIKIDQSFVRDATSDPNDAVMIKTIIGMAENFRLNVIAEGVETAAQLAFLRQNGCMAYQGYLFGKPIPVAEFEKVVRDLHE